MQYIKGGTLKAEGQETCGAKERKPKLGWKLDSADEMEWNEMPTENRARLSESRNLFQKRALGALYSTAQLSIPVRLSDFERKRGNDLKTRFADCQLF